MATLYADQNMTLSAGTPRVIENTPVPTSVSATTYLVSNATGVAIPMTFAAAGTTARIVWRHYLAGYLNPAINVCVDLEEFTGGAWVQRTNDVFALSEANFGARFGGTDLAVTGYPVTTAASTWRYRIYRQTGTGGMFYIYGSASQAECLVAFSAATTSTSLVTPTDNLWVGKGVTYTWDTSFAYGAVAGRWLIYFCDGATLGASTTEVAPYTISTTVAANTIFFSSSAIVRLGNSAADRVPAAGALIIDQSGFTSGNSFFETVNIYGIYNVVFYGFSADGGLSFYIYGEYPDLIRTKATVSAASGQPTISVSDDVLAAGWAAGDTVSIVGQQTAVSTGAVYTIASVTSSSVTFTANLPYNVMKGAALINRQQAGFGVQFINSGTSRSIVYPTWNTAIEIDGVFTQGTSLNVYSLDAATTKNLRNYLQAITTSGALAVNQTNWTITNYHQYVTYTNPGTIMSITGNSCILSNVTANSGYTNGGIYVTQTSNHTFTDVIFGSDCYAGGRSSSNYRNCNIAASNVTFTDCAFFNGYDSLFYLTKAVFTRCSWQYVYAGVRLFGGIDVTFDDCDFGGVVANGSADIYAVAGYIQSVLVKNSVMKTGIANVANAVAGSYVRVVAYDEIANDHRGYEQAGFFRSTGAGLPDTTVRTAGGFALRYEPSSSVTNLGWSFTVPTGNLASKTMYLSVWCKIAAAAFWAGTHEKPRLTVNYDDGTTAYVEATATTAWQLLTVAFTPVTAYGQITVTISCRTDAVGTDRYVYVDDFAVAFPPSVALDLGAMDVWANGLPVTPPLAIPLSSQTVAQSVWEELRAGHVTAGSYGATAEWAASAGLDAAGVRAAVGLAAANLDTQIGDLPTNAELALALNGIDVSAGLTAYGAAKTSDVTGAQAAIILAIGAISSITADDVLDEVVEGGLTLRQVMRVLLAFAAGRASGGGTVGVAYRDQANTKDRIALTVDAQGNRSAATVDGT